ncbi:NUDIX hydrolase [Gordoniibacillus kamchatkensis]|uniref:NUDIX hydrolase n=1 Tax=Gordoniibacillus kamchatkensis TaxID=1590651 RepID=A0ABR5AJ00_9BACL|nr:NUDIX hydrolase [Paenibacillus sp. VKM B-2647]KIL41027.1 NUDIX hydrolase [Paenibacillus sp. VKM B-2647]
MIRTRMIAAALLFNARDELLMMKRSPQRTLSPGLWGAVGGHMEPYELSEPYATVVREIREETGISDEQLHGLRLQYILIRLNGEEIRQQFIYVGRTDAEPSIHTDEGELHWISRDAVLDRPLPFIFRRLLEHYLTYGDASHPWMAVAGRDDGGPVVRFTPLLDPLPPGKA